jgi:carboxymethylenebutenolidase
MAGTDWPVHLWRGSTGTGVVLVHDITGLDATNRSFAERLAAEGFWVAAVDLFRGRTAASLQEGMALRQGLAPSDLRAALQAGHDRLRAEAPGVAIGCMGFCMGGGAALEGACAVPFAFCVDWYGMVQDADVVRGLAGPLLLILASEDDRINPWAYSQLLPRLDDHRKRVEVHLYPAVAHPFHRPDWEVSPFPGGGRSYDRAAAEDAWARALRFIRENSGR